MMRAGGIWLSFVCAAGLLAGASIAAYRELVPYFEGSGNPEERLAFLASEPPDPGLSLQAQRLVVNDCATTLLPFIGTTLSDQAAIARDNCRAVAGNLVREEPLFSYAWYGLAVTQALEGPTDAFQHSLSQSQLTTANQWAMASLRLPLAYTFWSDLSPALKTQLAADIVVVAYATDGRQWLARRYGENAEFREDVTTSLESAPDNIQRAFVRAVSRQGAAK